MKKVILVAMALILGISAYAQLSMPLNCHENIKGGTKTTVDWATIGSPFTANDVNGQSISLQSYMDSGYCVIIDYFACWCSPCWNVHTSGVLDSIWSHFGPEGDNTMRVLQVEIESSNTTDQLHGISGGSGQSGVTCGNWLSGVEYPTIDNTSPLSTCSSLFENAIPYIVFITPEGLYCSIYGESYGILTSSITGSISNMASLRDDRPQGGEVPTISISGPTSITAGSSATFTANIMSIDQVTDISWSAAGATVISGNQSSFTTSWTTTGTYTVNLSVTNTTGTSTETFTVEVFDWNWDNTMSYGSNLNDNLAGPGFRLQSSSNTTWGAMFPAQFMTGRQFMKSVTFYAVGVADYTIDLYQGGDNEPETKIYSRTVRSQGEGWQTVNCSGAVPLDQTKNLWVTLTAPNTAGYVISIYKDANGGMVYCGDPNGCWVKGNSWFRMTENGSNSYEVTFAIKATTGDEANTGINTLSYGGLNIYPNPTTGIVSIDAERIQTVDVIDVMGRTVKTVTTNTFDMSALENGIYMLRINTENGTTFEKVMKK